MTPAWLGPRCSPARPNPERPGVPALPGHRDALHSQELRVAPPSAGRKPPSSTNLTRSVIQDPTTTTSAAMAPGRPLDPDPDPPRAPPRLLGLPWATHCPRGPSAGRAVSAERLLPRPPPSPLHRAAPAATEPPPHALRGGTARTGTCGRHQYWAAEDPTGPGGRGGGGGAGGAEARTARGGAGARTAGAGACTPLPSGEFRPP